MINRAPHRKCRSMSAQSVGVNRDRIMFEFNKPPRDSDLTGQSDNATQGKKKLGLLPWVAVVYYPHNFKTNNRRAYRCNRFTLLAC